MVLCFVPLKNVLKQGWQTVFSGRQILEKRPFQTWIIQLTPQMKMIRSHNGHEILSFHSVIPIVRIHLQCCYITIHISKESTESFCEVISCNMALMFTPRNELSGGIPSNLHMNTVNLLDLCHCNKPKRWIKLLYWVLFLTTVYSKLFIQLDKRGHGLNHQSLPKKLYLHQVIPSDSRTHSVGTSL